VFGGTVGFVETVDVGIIMVGVGGGSVGVGVAGMRRSGVIVGTGDKRIACKVPIRSCGLPVPGMSVMIWFRIFSSMGGMTRSWGSWL
jgi:hypothetical protein